MKTGIRIVYNRLLAGWYIVRGPHQAPLGGRFESRAAAKAHLERQSRLEREVEADYLGEAAAERHADRVGVQDQAFNRYWISTEDEA